MSFRLPFLMVLLLFADGEAWGRTIENCPPTPNCVSSNPGENDGHHVSAFSVEGQPAEAWESLKKLLRSKERVAIVEDAEGYIRAEFTSKVFGFIDDVEFLLDSSNKQIQVRSASRVGYWDFGVNRERIESLRKQMLETRAKD